MGGTFWQPLTWIMFHTLALNYEERYKDHYITFFDSLKTIIPCKMCRDHYTNFLNKNNINNVNLFNWTIDMHNNVNRMNHTKQWSHEESYNYYKNNNFSNQVLKNFIIQYIQSNFKKSPLKTGELLRMLKTLPYLHPDESKRTQLIEFKEKFDLTRGNIRKWITAFIIIIK